MTSFGSEAGDVLYLVVCAAPPAREAELLVAGLRGDGWDVSVITTPAAQRWVDGDALAEASGHPVRSQFRGPDDDPFHPLGDAVLVAPATFNTVNKVASGINDTLALGLVNEALGRGYPVAMVPWASEALTAHPAYAASVALLEAAGVRFAHADGFVATALAAAKALLRPPAGGREGGRVAP